MVSDKLPAPAPMTPGQERTSWGSQENVRCSPESVISWRYSGKLKERKHVLGYIKLEPPEICFFRPLIVLLRGHNYPFSILTKCLRL